MYEVLFDISFLVLFTICLSVAFYIPGRVVLGNKFKASPLAVILLSLVVGMVLWGWQGFILGYLHLRWGSYLYLVIFAILYFQQNFSKEIIKQYRFPNFDWLSLMLILLGTIAQNIFYFRTGTKVTNGILQVSFNPPDHLWHSSLINEMTQRFPPNEPGMYGILVSNYHYWFNLVTAELIRVFHLPLFPTQYLGMYLFCSLMAGGLLWIVASTISQKVSFHRWLLFFFYFSGDASYWITFILHQKFDFLVPSIIDVSTNFIDNPPRAFSILVYLACFYFIFTNFINSKKRVVLFSLLASSLVGFKIYTGVGLFVGLGFLSLYKLYKGEKNYFLAIILSFILALGIFIPVNANSGGFIFIPFDRPRDFITYRPLGFNDFELRTIQYKLHNNYLRIFQYGVYMTIVYLIAQYGIKIIGFFPFKRVRTILGKEKMIFMYGTIFGVLLIALTVAQKAHTSDSFNFYLPPVFMLMIITSLFLSVYLENLNKKLKFFLIILVIGFIIPRFIYREVSYINSYAFKTPPVILNSELDSYNYLKNDLPKNSLILVLNQNSFDNISAIVALFSNQHMFLSGQQVITAHQADNQKRLTIVDAISKNTDPAQTKQLIEENHIQYLYLYDRTKNLYWIDTLGYTKIYDNGFATVYSTEQ